MNPKLPRLTVLAAALLSPMFAHATNGYFSHGYGIKSQGIAGIGIALPQDGLAAATNPAGTALVGDRVDLGLSWFQPKRGAEITSDNVISGGTYDGNETKSFFIPELGYAKQLSSTLGVGVAVYGNGGMNTDYANNPFAKYDPSAGKGGINLEQLFISPSIAWKPNAQNSIGAALNFAYQRFEAKGLSAFAPASTDSSNLTNNGRDTSTGWGVRLGWIGQLTTDLSLGATWSSKIKASKFDKYKGLFADAGSFDIPENYGIGISYKATPALTLAADAQEIKYGSVRSVANPLANLTVLGQPLGSANGGGFGWKDITVYKLGASYDYSKDLTLRAGISHSDQPVPADQTFFNILAPGVVQDHLTFGGTWKTTTGELSLSYFHGFKKTVNGSNSIPVSYGGGNADIHLEENGLGIAYGWRL
jgi:long-chain fatty acid transport protein